MESAGVRGCPGYPVEPGIVEDAGLYGAGSAESAGVRGMSAGFRGSPWESAGVNNDTANCQTKNL